MSKSDAQKHAHPPPHHHHHETQEVDVLCLIQCSSPFIQPDFLESGYKLILQVTKTHVLASSLLLAWHVIRSNIYMGHTPITGSMVIIVVFVFHGRHYCHLFLIMKERKFIIVVVVFLFIRVVVIIFLFIRVTTRCSRRQDARSCAGKK